LRKWQLEREWLEADGCGGFASGTVSGVRTRRYHGTRTQHDVQHPDGHRRLHAFSATPRPTWTFCFPDGSELSQERFVTHGALRIDMR
jgi:hypothetical protein